MTFEKEFNNWISRINTNESPSKEIIAFWFGLFESKNGFTMYLIGSKEFDEKDDNWACSEDFVPQHNHFELPAVYSIDKKWEEVLDDSLNVLRSFVASDEFNGSIFQNPLAIAVGFDNGDLHRIR